MAHTKHTIGLCGTEVTVEKNADSGQYLVFIKDPAVPEQMVLLLQSDLIDLRDLLISLDLVDKRCPR